MAANGPTIDLEINYIIIAMLQKVCIQNYVQLDRSTIKMALRCRKSIQVELSFLSVSYTHLDVYKRQEENSH